MTEKEKVRTLSTEVEPVSKTEALSDAQKLVQEALDVATKAGIDPSDVVAPFCAEAAVNQNPNCGDSESLTWCCVPVIIDNETCDLFEMSKPDENPQQMPAFVVTQSTAYLVEQDFERYRPSLESMAEEWRKAKKPLQKAGQQDLNSTT
jgi:hypothetical protein